MSIPIFPIRPVTGTGLRVAHRFPTDAQLLSHGAGQWPSFMAEYQSPTSGERLAVVAPVDGRIRFLRREVLGIPFYLLEFIADSPVVFQAIPGWASPVPRSLVFNISVLIEETHRVTIMIDAIREFRRRGGHRLLRARVEGESVTSADPIDLGSGDIETHARNALVQNWPIMVVGGQPILNTDTHISMGMIHYEGENALVSGRSWYWFDAHEYYVRLKNTFPDDGQINFPFTETSSTSPYRIRYENNLTEAMTGDNRVNTITGGIQNVVIYHPPTQRIEDSGGAFEQREVALPPELFMLTPSAEVTIRLSHSPINYHYHLFRDADEENRVWQSPVFSGRDLTLRFSSIAYVWPEGRFQPYNLAFITENNVGFSFFMVRDLFEQVRELTDSLMEKKARLADFIRQDGNALKIKILEDINQVLRGVPSDFRSDLRDALDNTTFTGFSSVYMGIKNDLELTARELTNALDTPFFLQLKADPSDTNLEIYNDALNVLENEYQGEVFVRSISEGFMVRSEYSTAAEPPLTFDWFKGLWNSQRRFRGPVVKFLFTMVRNDMFHHARIASAHISLPAEQTRYLGRVQRSYQARFGELFIIESTIEATTRSEGRSILTGERITFTERVNLLRMDLDTDAIGNTSAGRTSGMSGATVVADALGHTLNVLNLLGTLWRVVEDTVAVFNGDRSYQKMYDLTRDMVSLSSDIYHLMPPRHYAGVARGPGFAGFFRGFNVVFGAVSLGKMMMSAQQMHASGQYLSAGLSVVAAAGSAVTIGAEALVLLGAGSATSGPLMIIIISGALISIWFELMANAVRDPVIVVDFSHTLFGVNYNRLMREYDALSDSERRDFVQAYFRNNRNSWVHNLNRQLAHLNNYLWPLNATFRSREVTGAGGTITGREFTIHLFQARAKAFSRVYFEVFAPGTPNLGTKGTFVIHPTAVRDGGWFPASEVVGSTAAFQYQATSASGETITLEIKTTAPTGSPFAGINQGLIAVTYEPSIEYILDPDHSSSIGISGDMIRQMRRNPFDLRLHEPPMENTANKSQTFLTIT